MAGNIDRHEKAPATAVDRTLREEANRRNALPGKTTGFLDNHSKKTSPAENFVATPS